MDQNSGKRVEDAGSGRGVRLREVAPGSWAVVDEETGTAVGGQAGRLELLTRWEDVAAQRAAIAAGYTREGVRRGDPELLVWSRLPGDPEGPTPRLLPDLPEGVLTDGVVTLRPLGASDIDFYTELHGIPDVVATSVPAEVKSAGEIHRRCTRSAAHWLAGQRADMVILDAATGERAGQIDLYYQEPPTGQAMIGYSMLPSYRRRGFHQPGSTAGRAVGLR
ncbi:GNAT family N-acetyltransferase [Actinoplanes utahensis]|uniref:GNAT family N-acetyltransferase n=1 Tax=Actinoplanes utahensis TaxID=1869 RepID=UPI00068E49A3|nr:GNAT family N-acetyltransferase [Actinoplanes utahensis]